MDLIKEEWLLSDKETFLSYLKTLSKGNEKSIWEQRIVNTKLPCLAIPSTEIDKISKQIYKGNYTSYELQKKMNYQKQLEDYEYQQKEIKRLKDIADRFRYKPTKASMALSKLRKIEQMQLVDKPQNYDIKTFNTDLKGLIPKSILASIKLGSISPIFGNTDKMIYGSMK
jgi:hypothetical protein